MAQVLGLAASLVARRSFLHLLLPKLVACSPLTCHSPTTEPIPSVAIQVLAAHGLVTWLVIGPLSTSMLATAA